VLAQPLPRLGPGTITSSAALDAELDEIRAVGYAVSREETNEGAWGLAAPILGMDGVLLGSIGMAGPLVRCTPDTLESARHEVLASAHRAEATLVGAVDDRPKGEND
jgi:DNA-binding IclR family transcriptional regulator